MESSHLSPRLRTRILAPMVFFLDCFQRGSGRASIGALTIDNHLSMDTRLGIARWAGLNSFRSGDPVDFNRDPRWSSASARSNFKRFDRIAKSMQTVCRIHDSGRIKHSGLKDNPVSEQVPRVRGAPMVHERTNFGKEPTRGREVRRQKRKAKALGKALGETGKHQRTHIIFESDNEMNVDDASSTAPFVARPPRPQPLPVGPPLSKFNLEQQEY